jgi:O-antigen/teichoic acid export membrane protein
LLPRLTTLSTLADEIGLREAYLRSARVACFVAGWLGALIISIGPDFISLWAGPEYAAVSYWVLFWLSIASFSQALSTQVPYPFYQALHMLRLPAAVLFLEGLCNLGLSITLAPRLGINGVALATALPAIFISLLTLPAYLCRRLGLSVATLLVRSVMPGLAVVASVLGSQVAAAEFVPAQTYLFLAVRAMVSVPAAFVVFLLMFPKVDQHAFWRVVRWSSLRSPGNATVIKE